MENTRASHEGSAAMRAETKHNSGNEADASGVSWPAVWAGGVVTAALSLILLVLGTGLGFASVSVLPGSGVSPSTAGSGAIVWFIATQLISAALGGYLAGRLRTKWAGIHSDEVYFRDTAHGFLAWSVAFVLSAALLTSAAATLVGSSAASSGGAANQTSSRGADTDSYFADSLFRGDSSKAEIERGPAVREAVAIFVHALQQGELSSQDRHYLDQLVMAKTGASQGEADKRVSDTFAGAQTAAEAARKALAHTLLWTFVALLIGAFSASFAGTIGGRQRDQVVLI